MARVQHNCTGCVPIDASIIEVYTQLISTESRAEEAAERAEHAAEHAIGKSPYIGENGDWWEWNDEQAAFIDTGVQAQGQVAVDIEMSTTSTNPVQNRVVTAAVNEKYTKPATGIPATDIAEGVIPDVSQFITASVNNLVNYYLKSETYNKTEVDSLIAAVSQFSYEVVATLPTASASTMYKIYLVPSAHPETQNVKDEYITIRSGSEGSYTYAWEQIGSTAIDLSGYVTTQQLNTALSAYTTTANLTTLLAAKQDVIADLATIRSGAASGATAYQKPSGGIPKSDLSSGVQGSLDLADSAIQARPQGEITPVITPADYATREELGELEAKVVGIDISFENKSYQTIQFGTTVHSGTTLNNNGYNYGIYLYDANGGEYFWNPANHTYTTSHDLVRFTPTNNAAGRITTDSIVNQLKTKDGEIEELVYDVSETLLELTGIDVPFVNKSYQNVPFDIPVPIGTVLNNNGYSGYIYLYDKDGNEYGWNPANPTYTTSHIITSFKPTSNAAGKITSDGNLPVIEGKIDKTNESLLETQKNIGIFNVSIWGGQVNNSTGQLYNSAYNGYHFSDAIPVDGATSVYCDDSRVDSYMFYSAKPQIGTNTGIYLGFNTNGQCPNGATFAVVVFDNQYVPSEQPFPFYTNKVAYDVTFASKKMKGKKMVTLGDSLTQSCKWQPRVQLYSGMDWDYNETYYGVGYVNINDGTYTTDDKSADPDYRPAYKMGYAGTPLRPTGNNSIYIRAQDAKFYNPEVIMIWAGENDDISTWKSSGNTGTTPDEIVALEPAYTDGVVDSSVSAIAAYKGMIQQLMEDIPNVVIYLITAMQVYGEVGKDPTGVYADLYPHPRFATIQDVISWQNTTRIPKVEYVKAIGRYYGLPVVELYYNSGINAFNASQWYGATAEDCTQVHPNTVGYLRVADVVLQNI